YLPLKGRPKMFPFDTARSGGKSSVRAGGLTGLTEIAGGALGQCRGGGTAEPVSRSYTGPTTRTPGFRASFVRGRHAGAYNSPGTDASVAEQGLCLRARGSHPGA